MPSINLYNKKEIKKSLRPVAIVKGDDDMKEFNQFVCVDSDANKGEKSISLPDNLIFSPITNANPRKRDIYYIAGASGSGKSYMCGMLINNYNKLHPDRPVYLISKLESDETLDKYTFIERIGLQELVDNPFNINSMEEDCLFIFDDYDNAPKEQLQAVQTLIDEIAITGRHKNISMIVISHYLTNYKSTRLVLNEAHYFVLYPQATSYHQLRYTLMNYVGMDKEEVTALKKLNSRWTLIHKQFPQFVISQHKAYLLNQEF